MARRFPLITAHSGCMNTVDNTLQSVEAGIRFGADVIEEDVRVTKDDIPVLAHNDVLYTIDGHDYNISKMVYRELSELQIAVTHGDHLETMHICRLQEMLPLIQASGKIANLDLKVDESIEPVAALVKTYRLLDQVFFSGSERDRAMKEQQLHPEFHKLLDADTSLFLSMDYKDAVSQTLQDAQEAHCFGVNIDYRLVRSELLDAAAASGLPIYVWTVNEEISMRQFIDMGVASITTRNVERLVQLKQTIISR